VTTQPSVEPVLTEPPVKMGDCVFEALADDLKNGVQSQVLLVADANTYQACGEWVEAAVSKSGLSMKRVMLDGEPWVAADEVSIARVLHALNGLEHILAAVGSGTITDIVRYVAFQTRLPFVSIPTAASVDAYTSITASITLQQVKFSFLTRPARKVYAHLPTLCAAPHRLTAAGFSDMVAKYTALADWQLAHLLVGDAYHEQVARQAKNALQACVEEAGAIRGGDSSGIRALFDGMAVSGRCMAAVGNSRPAAGSEHSLAHFWEIDHQVHHLPPSLHGEKTGVASIIIAGLYERLRGLSAPEAALRLQHFSLPDPGEEAARLQSTLGPAAESLLAVQPSFLGITQAKAARIKENLVAQWDQVQNIVSSVPPQAEMKALLERVGSPHDSAQIHVQPEEVDRAIENGMYVRDRLTILEINRMLGLTSKT